MIERLQEQGTPLNDALKIVEEILGNVNKLEGPYENSIQTKLANVLNKNIKHGKICKISKVK